ncbi:MAG TPA: M28 family peptidase [Azospirillum sp.]|nr:M28 family peptidase [Azospirillum sp.]
MSDQAPATDAGRLEASVRYLAGDIGERNVRRPAALAAAADYIEARWQAQGYDVTRQWYEAAGLRCANLEVTRSGRQRGGEILLIGAHYDTVPGSPGADDNASGVAALIEIAGLFTSILPSMTVRFVAFTNEEPPFYMGEEQGSIVYARAARARGDDIRLMVSLEMLGFYRDTPRSQNYPPLFRWFYPDRGNFLGFVGNLRSRAVMLKAARCFRAGSDFPLEHVATLALVPGVSWSDHRSFWLQGYRAFMATDTAFYRNPHYHTARDRPNTLAYPEFARATQGLYRCFAAVASKT